MLVIPPHMGRLDPLHPAAQIAVARRPQHEMKMVRDPAVRQHPPRIAGRRIVKQPQERRVIRLLVKHALPPVPAIETVVAITPWNRPPRPWHGRRATTPPRRSP